MEYIICGVGHVTRDELAPDGKVAKRVIQLRRQCLSIKEIAKIIHKSDRYVSYVLFKTHTMDLGTTTVRQLRAKGLSIKAIAKRLKIRDRTVACVVRKHFRKTK